MTSISMVYTEPGAPYILEGIHFTDQVDQLAVASASILLNMVLKYLSRLSFIHALPSGHY